MAARDRLRRMRARTARGPLLGGAPSERTPADGEGPRASLLDVADRLWTLFTRASEDKYQRCCFLRATAEAGHAA